MKITVSKNIQEYIRKIKTVFKSNKMTLIIITLYTIWEAAIAAVPYEYYWDIHFGVDVMERALRYLIIPSLFIEIYFVESKVKCVCGYVIAIIFSGAVAACGDLYTFSEAAVNRDLPVQVLEILPVSIQRIAGPRGSLLKARVELFLCTDLLILFVAVVYKCFKNTQLCFTEYMIKVFKNVAKSLLILPILRICCAYVDSTLAEGVFHKYYFEYTEQIYGTILVMGIFYLGPVGVLVMGLYLGPEMIFTLRGMD